MKKYLIIVLVIIIVAAGIATYILLNRNTETAGLQKIRVNEVTRSVFYAPQYVAISKGYFTEEGLEIELTTGQGADKVMTAVLANQSDIGFAGPEASIYVYNEGKEDYTQVFAQLTKRDGSFLVSREEIDNFTLEDLKGKTVIGGRRGGMPEMTFVWGLMQNNIDPTKDLNIDTSVAFAAMEGAFIGGNGDFVTLFEPNATSVEKQGLGHIVAYVGTLGGEVPYTAYNAKKSFIENNESTILSFSKAIDKGLKFVEEKSPKEIAKSIISYFPDTKFEDLTTMIQRYKENDAWRDTIAINETEWTHIQDIMRASNELTEYVPYDKLIYGKYFSKFK
mgnify:CR=1 FL=1